MVAKADRFSNIGASSTNPERKHYKIVAIFATTNLRLTPNTNNSEEGYNVLILSSSTARNNLIYQTETKHNSIDSVHIM